MLPRTWGRERRVRWLQTALGRLLRDPESVQWARALAGRITDRRAPREVQRRALLSWVQSLPYVPDEPGSDAVRSPAETARVGGECKERSVLLGLLLAAALGATVELVWIPQEGAPLDHVSLWEWERGGRRTWLDATVPGARVGEYPADAAARVGPSLGPGRGVYL